VELSFAAPPKAGFNRASPHIFHIKYEIIKNKGLKGFISPEGHGSRLKAQGARQKKLSHKYFLLVPYAFGLTPYTF
jgi:hypothetical protein